MSKLIPFEGGLVTFGRVPVKEGCKKISIRDVKTNVISLITETRFEANDTK